MKKFAVILGGVAALLAVVYVVFVFVVLPKEEKSYQANAALKRRSDVYEIASLLEECHDKQGVYPFVRSLQAPSGEGYMAVPLAVMLHQPDQDWVHQKFPFNMRVGKYPAQALIEELSGCLGKKIDLPVDPQRRPYLAPNTYIVLFTEDDSYAIIAFLYDEQKYTSPLAEHAHALTVTSKLGPEGGEMLRRMRIASTRFMDIPAAEVAAAREVGKRMDERFSHWAATRVH